MHALRLYHAMLATFALLAYATGELGILHAWLGYGVALVIALRLLWALSGHRYVGLMRFYPSFDGLHVRNALTHPAISKVFMLGILLSLLAVTASGLVLDRGRSLGLTNPQILAHASADHEYGDEDDTEDFLEEMHEFFANTLLLFVGLHIVYLLCFKLPLARFMLFIPKTKPGSTSS